MPRRVDDRLQGGDPVSLEITATFESHDRAEIIEILDKIRETGCVRKAIARIEAPLTIDYTDEY